MQLRRNKPQPTAAQGLWRIAETNDTDAVAAILATGVDINARNGHGMTVLMRAAALGRVRMVRSLLEHGADPNLSRNDQFTALLLAAFFGHEEIVKILIAHGADRTAVTRFATSAQMWAAARTFGGVVDYLSEPEKQEQIKDEITTNNVEVSIPTEPRISYDAFVARPTSLVSLLSWKNTIALAASLAVIALIGLATDFLLRPDKSRPIVSLPMQQQQLQVQPNFAVKVLTPPPVTNSSTPANVQASKTESDNVKLGEASNLRVGPVARPLREEQKSKATEAPSVLATANEPSAVVSPPVVAAVPKPTPIAIKGPVLPKVPVPQTSLLVTSTKDAATSGKVIKWP